MENGTVVMDWICRIISPFPKCGTRNEVEVPVHYFSFEMDFFPLIQVAEISPQVLKWMTKTGWFSVEPFSCAIQIMGAKDLTHLNTTKILWFILIFPTPIATWAPHFCLQTSKKTCSVAGVNPFWFIQCPHFISLHRAIRQPHFAAPGAQSACGMPRHSMPPRQGKHGWTKSLQNPHQIIYKWWNTDGYIYIWICWIFMTYWNGFPGNGI